MIQFGVLMRSSGQTFPLDSPSADQAVFERLFLKFNSKEVVMEFISGVFFTGFYLFSIVSLCGWVYLAYAHDGVWAYLYLSGQKSFCLLNPTLSSVARTHFERVSILVCFIIFLVALCYGFSYYFSWIPDRYYLTLGDGSVLHLSRILSCLVGICSSLVFGRWVFSGICSYWEKRALAEQSDLYFDIIREADNIEALEGLKRKTLKKIGALEERQAFTPGIVRSRLELGVGVIDCRIKDIRAGEA